MAFRCRSRRGRARITLDRHAAIVPNTQRQARQHPPRAELVGAGTSSRRPATTDSLDPVLITERGPLEPNVLLARHRKIAGPGTRTGGHPLLPLPARSGPGCGQRERLILAGCWAWATSIWRDRANALADRTGDEHHWLINPDTGEIAFWRGRVHLTARPALTAGVSAVWWRPGIALPRWRGCARAR